MNGIKYVFQKEMTRVFKDKKMIFSLFVLPVVLIVGLYSLMGNVMSNSQDDIEAHEAVIAVVNAPESFKDYLDMAETKGQVTYDPKDVEQVKNKILTGDTDLMLEFPDGFEADITAYKSGDEIPQIKTFYNPSEEYSNSVWTQYVTSVLEGYKQLLLAERTGDINSVTIFYVDSDNPDMIIQDDEKASGKMLGTMIPYLITILLFAGAMSLGVDTITGEKERGTMASMLITPVKRSSIVLGKLFSLMFLSALSAAAYVVSMVVAMPTMMKSMTGGEDLGLTIVFTPGQIIEMAVILIVLVFLYVALIGAVAVYARTAKEATTYVMPVYILVVATGMITMLTSKSAQAYEYCIPLYNSSIALKALFARELTTIQFALTALSNLGAGLIITGIIVKAFNSEKIMFNA